MRQTGVVTINHVHLGTKDMRRAEEFYHRHFGFRKKSDHGSGVFLSNDAGFLIAIDTVEELPQFPDWYHLGFCLDSPDKVQDLYQAMKLAGVQIARNMKSSPGEFASFFVKDPDGNKIEISWHNE
jgi:catechol-2,3-dioxygenase